MTVETPCINVCTLDPARGLCIGCGRTLSEIARWGTMTADERARIMATLRDRLVKSGPGGTPAPPKR